MSTSEPRRSRVARPAVVEVELHSLALAQHPEHRSFQGALREIYVGKVRLIDEHSVAGGGVVALDDALHGAAA